MTGSLFNAATPRPSFHATMASVPRQKAKHPKYWRKSYCPPLLDRTLPLKCGERERERKWTRAGVGVEISRNLIYPPSSNPVTRPNGHVSTGIAESRRWHSRSSRGLPLEDASTRQSLFKGRSYYRIIVGLLWDSFRWILNGALDNT